MVFSVFNKVCQAPAPVKLVTAPVDRFRVPIARFFNADAILNDRHRTIPVWKNYPSSLGARNVKLATLRQSRPRVALLVDLSKLPQFVELAVVELAVVELSVATANHYSLLVFRFGRNRAGPNHINPTATALRSLLPFHSLTIPSKSAQVNQPLISNRMVER